MRESGQEVRARFSSSAMNFRSSKDSSRRATVSFLQVRQRAAIPQRGCPDTWTSTTTVEFNALSSCNYCGGWQEEVPLDRRGGPKGQVWCVQNVGFVSGSAVG